MSNFECKVVRVDAVENHPNADRLTIVRIAGFNCISNKLEDGSWRYKAGDLVVYIPEGAVLPEWLLRRLDMWNDEKGKGFLNGPEGNRVKAIKLRGIVSQGVLYAVTNAVPEKGISNAIEFLGSDSNLHHQVVSEGDNVASILGITKYEPPVPMHMSGQVTGIHGHTLNFDVENIQKYPDVFKPTDFVVATEKLHGTFCGLGLVPNLNNGELLRHAAYPGLNMFAFSKGLGAQGLVFKNVKENEHNIYHKTLLAVQEDMIALYQKFEVGTSIYVLGEVFGKGVQDLHYGLDKPEFRVFDVYIGKPGEGYWVVPHEDLLKGTYFKSVPTLYEGFFDPEVVTKLRDEKSAIAGGLREGVVVRVMDCDNPNDPLIGRKILKAVSPNYLLRKGDTTEFN